MHADPDLPIAADHAEREVVEQLVRQHEIRAREAARHGDAGHVRERG
jgi:hypothetical protein